MNKIFILFTLFFTIPVSYAQKTENKCYKNIQADEFYIRINTQETFLIDVRMFKEYRKNRIKGALLAANKESLLSLCKKLDKNTPVYVYCEDGDRSRTAARILCREMGFKHVYNLQGGLREWEKKFTLENTRIKKKDSSIFDY